MRLTLAFTLLVTLIAGAQAQSPQGHQHMSHGAGGLLKQASPMPSSSGARAPTKSGQSAFAAIQEVVEILEVDPKTDWSKVNVEALRRHLIDMDNVTLRAQVKDEAMDGGMRFILTASGAVKASIRRMLTAHAKTMDGVGNWRFVFKAIDGGASLSVTVPPSDLAKLRGLGFIGVMTRGMHHQEHHLMLARGMHPHGG